MMLCLKKIRRIVLALNLKYAVYNRYFVDKKDPVTHNTSRTVIFNGGQE